MMKKTALSEKEIDQIVIAQAGDDSAWEEAIDVKVDVPTMMSLSPELAARAAFFARLHNVPDVETWVQSIIQERLDFEEKVLAGLKQVFDGKPSYHVG